MTGNMNVKGLRRIDVARATGCNLETVRYYEKVGILHEPPRSANGYRVYDESHVARLRFVMRARKLGFPLEEVRSLLGLGDGGAATCAEVREIAEAHLETVRERIADLRRIEQVLSETVSKCSGRDVPECALIEAIADNDQA